MNLATAAATNDEETLMVYWWEKRDPYEVEIARCSQPGMGKWTTALVDARAPLSIGHGLVMLRGNGRIAFVTLRSQEEFNTTKALIAVGDLQAAHRVIAFERRGPDGTVENRMDAEQAVAQIS